MPHTICTLPLKECWRCRHPIFPEEDVAWRQELTGVSRHWYWGKTQYYELVPFHGVCARERRQEKQRGWCLLVSLLTALLLPAGVVWVGAAWYLHVLWRKSCQHQENVP